MLTPAALQRASASLLEAAGRLNAPNAPLDAVRQACQVIVESLLFPDAYAYALAGWNDADSRALLDNIVSGCPELLSKAFPAALEAAAQRLQDVIASLTALTARSPKPTAQQHTAESDSGSSPTGGTAEARLSAVDATTSALVSLAGFLPVVGPVTAFRAQPAAAGILQLCASAAFAKALAAASDALTATLQFACSRPARHDWSGAFAAAEGLHSLSGSLLDAVGLYAGIGGSAPSPATAARLLQNTRCTATASCRLLLASHALPPGQRCLDASWLSCLLKLPHRVIDVVRNTDAPAVRAAALDVLSDGEVQRYLRCVGVALAQQLQQAAATAPEQQRQASVWQHRAELLPGAADAEALLRPASGAALQPSKDAAMEEEVLLFLLHGCVVALTLPLRLRGGVPPGGLSLLETVHLHVAGMGLQLRRPQPQPWAMQRLNESFMISSHVYDAAIKAQTAQAAAAAHSAATAAAAPEQQQQQQLARACSALVHVCLVWVLCFADAYEEAMAPPQPVASGASGRRMSEQDAASVKLVMCQLLQQLSASAGAYVLYTTRGPLSDGYRVIGGSCLDPFHAIQPISCIREAAPAPVSSPSPPPPPAHRKHCKPRPLSTPTTPTPAHDLHTLSYFVPIHTKAGAPARLRLCSVPFWRMHSWSAAPGGSQTSCCAGWAAPAPRSCCRPHQGAVASCC